MSCKKILNDPQACVDEMLRGIIAAHPRLILIPEQRIIFHSKIHGKQVALISGGGSGHEPFAAGYVGEKMLTAAVAGSVFASPPSQNIVQAIKVVSHLNQNSGILLIVPNYTGDRLNFGLAAEEAHSLNIQLEVIKVGEDCALLDDNLSNLGNGRGLCGHLFVFKIAGAMAMEGQSLQNILNTCKIVTHSMATLGVCLKPCSLPGQGPLFHLADDEMELGLGVHGEAGVSKLKLMSASETVKIILDKLCKCLLLQEKSEVCVLLNNLGGTSQLEMGVVASVLKDQLVERGISVNRLYVGPLMTSIAMSGIQVCLLKIDNNIDWLRYLDEPTEASAWPGSALSVPSFETNSLPVEFTSRTEVNHKKNNPLRLDEKSALTFKLCAEKAALELIKYESKINDLDSICGDGDCGSTLARFANEIVNKIKENILPFGIPSECLHQFASIASEKMGGTSGAVYGLFFTKLACSLNGHSPFHWSSAWLSGIECIMKYSLAELGDRTLLDVLIPAQKAFENCEQKNDSLLVRLQKMVEAAKSGCEKTKTMKARVGRASYVNETYICKEDAGAYAVSIILDAIFSILREQYHN